MSLIDRAKEFFDQSFQYKTDFNKTGIDMNTLNNILDFIVPILNLMLGMILVLMAQLFQLIICLEIAYITIPLLRQLIDQSCISDDGKISSKIMNKMQPYLKDARKAVQIQAMQGRNPMGVYLRLKIKQMILIAVALYLAVNIGSIISIVQNLVEPLIYIVFGS